MRGEINGLLNRAYGQNRTEGSNPSSPPALRKPYKRASSNDLRDFWSLKFRELISF